MRIPKLKLNDNSLSREDCYNLVDTPRVYSQDISRTISVRYLGSIFCQVVSSMLVPNSGGGDTPVPSSMLFPDSGFEIADPPP